MKLGINEIMMINALENVSGVSARDCIIKGKEVIFLLNGKQMGLAIGRNGQTIAKIRTRLKKNVELFEYAENPEDFLRKAFGKINIESIKTQEKQGKKVMSVQADSENKKRMLQNIDRLKQVKEIMKRNYGIAEVRIR